MNIKRAIMLFFRNVKTNPKLFLIKLMGFSVGVMASMFVYLFDFKEYRADRFHKKHSDIYRVISTATVYDLKNSSEFLPLGELLEKTFPKVEKYARIWEDKSSLTADINESFENQDVWYVDRSFFELFDFELSVGDYKQLFNAPDGIVITEKFAATLFQGRDPIGKIIELKSISKQEGKKFTVVGLMRDYPEESSMQPQIIANIEDKLRENSHYNQWALSSQLFLYIPNSRDNSLIASQIPSLIKQETAKSRFIPNLNSVKFALQPLTDIYLDSGDVNDSFLKGDLMLFRIFSIVGFAFLLITSLNYVILSLGFNSNNKRFGEIHYVLGGNSISILKALIIDSIIFTSISFVVVMLFYPSVYKIITSFGGYRYLLFAKSDWLTFSSFYFILLLFGALSGYLQYLFVERFTHKKIVVGIANKRQYFFYVLIQFQLVLFIATFISLFFINRQMQFMRKADLGFDAENTYCIPSDNVISKDFLKQELEKKSYVRGISSGQYLFRNVFSFEKVNISNSDKNVETQVIWGDNHYLDVYGIKLLEGRNPSKCSFPTMTDFFDKKRREGTITELLVNKEFVRLAELKKPLETFLKYNSSQTGQIVGVFDDVKNLPLRYNPKPIVISNLGQLLPILNISIEAGFKKQFFSDLKSFYEKENLVPFSNIKISHYDFEKEYAKERQLVKLIGSFSIVALMVMMLGLVGLSLFIAENKTKEIGIRKVNGAKVSEILTLLNRDFIKWVAIAFVIAMPIGWYAMNKWLESFAYKTELSWWIFTWQV